jgi:hypothetical protein
VYQALSEAVEEINASRTRSSSLRIYAGILPEYRKTLDSIDAMLRKLKSERALLKASSRNRNIS